MSEDLFCHESEGGFDQIAGFLLAARLRIDTELWCISGEPKVEDIAAVEIDAEPVGQIGGGACPE